MRLETVAEVVRWQQAYAGELPELLEIMFHGGEPLLASADFYRRALPILREGLAPRPLRFGIQSNLWLLTDELCELFREHGVSIGTSLDGPEAINDAQRGQGYFRRTVAGIERARRHGLEAGCICTFTASSAPRAGEIFDFFLKEGLNFSIHAALPPMGKPTNPSADGWHLTPHDHGELLVGLLERYLENLKRVRISTLDSMCRSLSAGHGGICTFTDCLGEYLAVGPDGTIYPCQRFVGLADFRLGNVAEMPSRQELAATPTWQAFAERQKRIEEECGDCAHLAYCRGGCPYNTLAANDGGRLRDPHCESYRRFFSYANDRALQEVFSPENLEAVVERPEAGRGLLRRGRLIRLMGDQPHPYEVRRTARRLAAAVVLAEVKKFNTKDTKVGGNLTARKAAEKFQELSLSEDVERAERGMRALQQVLEGNQAPLHKLYLHLTLACPLHCAHCYAEAGSASGNAYFSVEETVRLCRQAARLGFKLILTGGEPLVHPQREQLLETLGDLRGELRPMLTTLCTSMAVPLDEKLAQRLANSAGKIAVSVDGDRLMHDARRGKGSYELMLSNLRSLNNLRLLREQSGRARIALSARLSVEQIYGEAGRSVQALANELGLGQVKFRPVQPLGRALESGMECPPEHWWGHMDPSEVIAEGYSPKASCGIGQSLCVEPDGSAYPCYAWTGPKGYLGNVKEAGGLEAVVNSPAFRELSAHTVDSNPRCRGCLLRYLCGGACRSWNRQKPESQNDLDAAPDDCSRLYERSRELLLSALDLLDVPLDRWLEVGLPLPENPPELLEGW